MKVLHSSKSSLILSPEKIDMRGPQDFPCISSLATQQPSLASMPYRTTTLAATGSHHHRRGSSNHRRQQQQVATTTAVAVATTTDSSRFKDIQKFETVNANEDNVDFINNEDDVVAHVLDDDDVEVSDDDEVKTPSSMLPLETGNRSLRKAFRENNEQPLKIGFDYEDLEAIHLAGNGTINRQSVIDKMYNTVVERKVDKGYYEDLIETWRKGHSNKKTGQFKTTENEQRYLDMKAMKDNIKAGLIPFKTDQEILDEIVPSDNRQNMSGMGRKLPGGGSTSRRRANRAFGDIMTRSITQMFRQPRARKRVTQEQAERRTHGLFGFVKG
ncbi:hypothetical protein Tco_0601433 [Tanacetum coccineum]